MWHWILWHLFPDIQCSVTIESRHLFPRHLFPKGIKTPVSKRKQDTCFPTPDSKRNQDTCFPTPVSWHLSPPPKNQTPVSGQLKSKDWQKNLVKMRAKGFESMVLLFDQYAKWTVNFWYNLCFYFGDLHIVWSHIKARNPNIFFQNTSGSVKG